MLWLSLEHFWNHFSIFRKCCFGHSKPFFALFLDYYHQDMHKFSAWVAFHIFNQNSDFPIFTWCCVPCQIMLFHVIFGLVNIKSFFQGTYAYSISNDLITRQCIIEYALSIITKLKSINGRISKDKLHICFLCVDQNWISERAWFHSKQFWNIIMCLSFSSFTPLIGTKRKKSSLENVFSLGMGLGQNFLAQGRFGMAQSSPNCLGLG